MSRMMLLHDNHADAGGASGGGWMPELPLSNLRDPRPTKVARSINTDPANTQFKIRLNGAWEIPAVAIGPMNLTEAAKFRVTAYSDITYSTELGTTGWLDTGVPRAEFGTVPWGSRFWWSRRVPRDDPDQVGIWCIAVFVAPITAQYWLVEFEDPINPAGYLQAGRAFFGTGWRPSINFEPGSNSFSAIPLTKKTQALGGTDYFNVRPTKRQFSFGWSTLPRAEIWGDVYRIRSVCGLHKQVFVIPNPDDTANIHKQSFLGRLEELPKWSLANVKFGSTSFVITESR